MVLEAEGEEGSWRLVGAKFEGSSWRLDGEGISWF